MKKLLIATILASAAVSATSASAASWWVEPGITLNARSGPGTHYDVYARIHACSVVEVHEFQSGWAHISYKGSKYWVSQKYLQDHNCDQYSKPKKKSSY